MKKHTTKVIVFLLIVLSAVDCQKWNSNNGKIANGRRSSRTGSYYLDELNGGSTAEINQPPVKSQTLKTASTGGIGAWGYVSIILFVILSGMGIYYTIIFYPIVCKKQRMYHVMGHTTV